MSDIHKKIRAAMAAAVLVASSLATVSSASAEDRRVRIINETGHTIVRFYASNVGRDSWEEDILGQSVLRPGQSVTVNIDDGSGYCKYDFKAVFDDGDSLVRSNVDVCKISSYRYTED
jgi:predicted flavoprotein YhiN